MVEHTKGPWIHTPLKLECLSVHAASDHPHLTRGRICQIDGECNGFDFIPNSSRTRGEAEANAKLITAAPDLLEALQKLVDMHDDAMFICGADDAVNVAAYLANAREAIKKATQW